MLRFSPTARWVITAVLAVWLPVCCCEASGLVRMAWEALAPAKGLESCCCTCSDQQGERSVPAPADEDCADGCCASAVKMVGAQQPVLPQAAPVPAPVALCAVRAPDGPGRVAAAGVVRIAPAPTLLRLHCALIV